MTQKQAYPYQQLQIRYQKAGRGRPLILLHGWGSSSDVMMPLAEQFSEIRTCYVLDLPGFGATDAPPIPWNVNDYADMVLQFIRDVVTEPADLLAHSFGARITLKLCARDNSRAIIHKILITGGAGMQPHRTFSYYLKKYTARALKLPFLVLPPPARSSALQTLRKTRLWKALGSSDYAKLSGVMRETFVQTVSEYLEPCLPRISQEILLLWGTNDEATPLYQGRRMEKGIKNAALVEISHAGHYAFLDRPAHFTRIARAFFEE